MPITQWRLGLYIDKGSNTGTSMGGNVEGHTSDAKDYGKDGTTRIERLIQT